MVRRTGDSNAGHEYAGVEVRDPPASFASSLSVAANLPNPAIVVPDPA